MPTSSLPLDIKELLSKHIESVGQLEALFIFFERQEKVWTPELLGRELRSNTTSAARQMAHLSLHGFIQPAAGKDAFQFSSDDKNICHNVERLHSYYKEMSVAMIAYIYEKPQDKLKTFADAFKLRKD